jgi:hypothetical protein
MSQRESGYERKPADLYETPYWVTEALQPYMVHHKVVWEPAAGNGKMVRVLRDAGKTVISTDISTGQDFLSIIGAPGPAGGPDAIVTNPPYTLAKEFIEHSLRQFNPPMVAMLLRTDFDHAKTRMHLFKNCPQFSKKLVLTKRIVWFESPGAAPSFNHAWFIWERGHKGPPHLYYV